MKDSGRELRRAHPGRWSLALSSPETAVPGRDNGLLQAREIFERVRLEADLVTLSACATARLMTAFHRHLRAGATKDEALRRAQLELLADERSAHPFFWAPFTVVGDWR